MTNDENDKNRCGGWFNYWRHVLCRGARRRLARRNVSGKPEKTSLPSSFRTDVPSRLIPDTSYLAHIRGALCDQDTRRHVHAHAVQCDRQPYLTKVPRNRPMAVINSQGLPFKSSTTPPPIRRANKANTRMAAANFIAQIIAQLIFNASDSNGFQLRRLKLPGCPALRPLPLALADNTEAA